MVTGPDETDEDPSPSSENESGGKDTVPSVSRSERSRRGVVRMGVVGSWVVGKGVRGRCSSECHLFSDERSS